MAVKSSIEWTESTWNASTGCDAISPGCENCYAERMSHRLMAMGQRKYRNGFKLTTHPNTLDLPLRWKKPQRIFVNSMSDLFHDQVPIEYIHRVFSTMRRAHWHQFQVLTKRSGRLLAVNEQIDWPKNVWMGVSVESAAYKTRIDHLRRTDAAVKFLSLEPLIDDLGTLNLENIDWVIVGGESGPGARLMEEAWVDGIRRQCTARNVPFFFKQWGGTQKKRAGRQLNGRTYDEMPSPPTLIEIRVP
jgi:protein gp37